MSSRHLFTCLPRDLLPYLNVLLHYVLLHVLFHECVTSLLKDHTREERVVKQITTLVIAMRFSAIVVILRKTVTIVKFSDLFIFTVRIQNTFSRGVRYKHNVAGHQ